jgi:hypothetical protein
MKEGRVCDLVYVFIFYVYIVYGLQFWVLGLGFQVLEFILHSLKLRVEFLGEG